jgi:hypothetical protein
MRCEICVKNTVVELNRYAVGSCAWIGVGPRLVCCEYNVLPGSGYIDENEEIDLRPAGL